jgi:putative Mg2+ transporter-C (MgtC) family protein
VEFDLVSIQPDTQAEILIRVALAAFLGGLVGFEREFSDQPAGLRTHLLVSLGAALFSMAGAFAGTDPTRIAAQVAAGIGFIGAGVIFQQGMNVRGLTTAAALWVTAAIGTAVAFGLWVAATGSAIITVIALYGLKRFELWAFGRLKAEGNEPENEGG